MDSLSLFEVRIDLNEESKCSHTSSVSKSAFYNELSIYT